MLTLEKINEIISGIDFHLMKIHALTEELHLIRQSMDHMRLSQEKNYMWELEKLKTETSALRTELQRRGLPEANYYETQYKELQQMLDQWPKAVPEDSICKNEEMIAKRAKVIVNLTIGEGLDGKSFLDYGCGSDAVLKESGADIAVGFDIQPSANVLTNFEEVRAKGPYDVILIHDVLDHVENMTPIDALKQAKSVLKKRGTIYVKNHPWSAKHGGHLYQQINKGYMHLIFDEVELTRLNGYASDHNLKVITPMETYKHWFKEAGLEIKSAIPEKSEVDEFFTNPSHVRERLLTHWCGDELAMVNNMEIEFVEYILETQESQVF